MVVVLALSTRRCLLAVRCIKPSGCALHLPYEQKTASSLRTASLSALFFGSTSRKNDISGEVPFYGRPRSPLQDDASRISDRVGLLLHNALTAFYDPTRADAVAAVGEITGTVALRRLHRAMVQHETGRRILRDRPVVCKETIPHEKILAEAASEFPVDVDTNPDVTFGQAYGAYLKAHGFDPDERDAVRYIDDGDLAYVMLRYRQCHDFWHALTGLPPTVLGEVGLKWLELFQTGFPLAALSSTVGSLRLSRQERNFAWNVYLPWACRLSQELPFAVLMNVYYEEEWDTPLVTLRERLCIEAAPTVPDQQHH